MDNAEIARMMGIDAPKMDLRKAVGGLGGRLLYWEMMERVHKSMKWHNVPSLITLNNAYHKKPIIICGGGPSLNDCIPGIRSLQRQGGYVVTVNKTHDHLLSLAEPIIPFAHVLLDPMPWVADYTNMVRPDVKYFIASSCDPTVARRIRAKGGHVYLWHAGADFYGVAQPHPMLEAEYKNRDWMMVVGPTTVGLRTVILGYQLGFRTFHLLGFDSSMRPGKDGTYNLHAYEKKRPVDSTEMTVTLTTPTGAYEFYTNDHMSRQATDFQDMLEQIVGHMKSGAWERISMRLYGDGLLPCYAASIGLHADERMNERYMGARQAA